MSIMEGTFYGGNRRKSLYGVRNPTILVFHMARVCLILILSFFTSPSLGQEALPFWRKKPRLLRQISDQRRVVVSVKKEDGPKEKIFRVIGVGMVNVPLKPCFRALLQFENLPKVSSYFKVVRHQPQRKNVYIKMEAFGYVAHMLLAYKVRTIHPGLEQLDWKVISGSFRGMVGHYQLRQQSPKQTEVSLWARFAGKKFPLPAFFLKFTLEVIAEKVAQRMRTYLETEHRKKRDPNE